MESNSVSNHAIQVVTKSDERAAGVRFVDHEYDNRPNWTTRSKISNYSKKLQFPRKETYPSYERKGKFPLKYRQRRSKLFHVTLKLRLVDVNYNFESDWTELSDNNLASE